MYSESDLDSAVSAGVLSADTASALRAHAASLRATPMVDEENFRLLTGFNDIFVAVAGVLLLVGAAWTGGEVHAAVGGLLVAGCAWGLAEYFTRVRRMALPSIVFLLAFVGGVFMAAIGILVPDGSISAHSGSIEWILVAGSAAIAAGAAWAHWRRFHVPITIAAGAAALAGLATSLVIGLLPVMRDHLYPVLLLAGLAIFVAAMRWDMSDTQRMTRRSDVAFWLHLLAAPLIAHPVFGMLELLDGGSTSGKALIVVALYLVMGVVALAVDRRALLVSALGYVLYAIGTLMRDFGAVSLNLALTALIIGSALLLLSAFWQNARAIVVGMLPASIAARLPNTQAMTGIAPAAA
jgi:hypothetical protein